MKKWAGYESTKAYTENERLPVGGYVLKIVNVRLEEGKNGNSDVLVFAFEIAEGEHAGFFQRNFDAQTQEDKKWKGTYRLYTPKDDGSEQDGWTKRRFKTVMEAFEASNPGYHFDWDERKFKGKIIGAVFNNKEYEFNGRRGFFTNCYGLMDAQRIRDGKFKVPADTLLKNGSGLAGGGYPAGSTPGADGFMNIPDGIDEELPF